MTIIELRRLQTLRNGLKEITDITTKEETREVETLEHILRDSVSERTIALAQDIDRLLTYVKED